MLLHDASQCYEMSLLGQMLYGQIISLWDGQQWTLSHGWLLVNNDDHL